MESEIKNSYFIASYDTCEQIQTEETNTEKVVWINLLHLSDYDFLRCYHCLLCNHFSLSYFFLQHYDFPLSNVLPISTYLALFVNFFIYFRTLFPASPDFFPKHFCLHLRGKWYILKKMSCMYRSKDSI